MLNEQTLATSLASVLSCTELLADGMPRLTRGVAVDMIRAETQRAICALRTAHLLKHGVSQDRRLVEPRTILDKVLDAVRPEVRLRSVVVTRSADVGESARLLVDEDAVVSALASVVLLLAAGLQETHGARLELKVTSNGNDRVSFALSQGSVILPDACLKIVNSPGEQGTAATAALLALRHLADAYGGSAAASRLAHGTQVSLDLPASDLN